MDNPIIVALDGQDRESALRIAGVLQGQVWGFKLNDLYFAHGPDVVREIAAFGRVFLDAKFHDIPNTVANSLGPLADVPAEIISVHASGGEAMVAAAAAAAPGKIAAVSVLTALDEAGGQSVYNAPVREQVRRLAELAVRGGATYLVSSAHELADLTDVDLVKIVPGIRPAWYHAASDDQRRVMTPAQAVAAGAQLLVMGRPILRADDPAEAAERTLAEIASP